MHAAVKRRMIVGNRRTAKYRYAVALSIALGLALCSMPSDVLAGGVHFGIGIGVPFPAYVAPPPVVIAPPAVVVERTPPVVVYEEPVVVERRSRVYYYPSQRYHHYREGTRREYHRDRADRWEEYDEY